VTKNKNIAANNLLQTMKDGDIKKIKELLNSGVNLKSTIDGITFLTYAVMIGNIDLIYLLIESGANINQRCENSFTPLAHAAASGAFKEFKYLSDAGADFDLNYTIIINGAQSKENSLLMLAVIGGSLEICKHISENQTEIEKANASGITPLLASLHWEKAAVFNYLLSVGANPDPECLATGLASLEWMTPLMVASAKGTAISVKALLSKGADVNRTVAWGPSALKLAVISGDIRTIEEVLDAGALVDIIDMEGWTPLMNAVTEGNVEITKLLILRGANPNYIVASNLSSKTDGRTPLMNAAFNGHVEVAQVLLNAGASVNVETPLRASALSFAIQARARSSELLSVTSILPDSFESKDEAHEFHDDLLKRSLEVIKLLIAQGADITCKVDGVNAVIYIKSLEDKEMLQHFEKMDVSIPATKKVRVRTSPTKAKSATIKKVSTKAGKNKVLTEIQSENESTKLWTPSETLAAVVGAQQMARIEVVKQIWVYVKKYNLQDTINRRNINADARLKAVFGKEELSMFEMESLIDKHLS